MYIILCGVQIPQVRSLTFEIYMFYCGVQNYVREGGRHGTYCCGLLSLLRICSEFFLLSVETYISDKTLKLTIYIAERQAQQWHQPFKMCDNSHCPPTSAIFMEWNTPIVVEGLTSSTVTMPGTWKVHVKLLLDGIAFMEVTAMFCSALLNVGV